MKILVRNINCPFLIIQAKYGLKINSEKILCEYVDIYRLNK